MKKLRYFILMALLLTPMVASADTFKNGETSYEIEKKEFSCVSKESTLYGVDDEGNYLFGDPKSTVKEYVKVNSEGKCSKISRAEFDYLLGNNVEYIFTERDGKYVILEYINYVNAYGKIKTQDTTLSTSKIYFADNGAGYLEYIYTPKEEDLSNYYELRELALARGTTFDSNQTYYVVDESFAQDDVFIVVENPKKEDLDKYYYHTEKPYEEKVLDVINQEKIKDIAENVEFYPDLVYPLGNDKFLIGFCTEELANGRYYYVYYDSDGNYIEPLEYSYFLEILDGGLYVVDKLTSFSIYNANYEEIYKNSNRLSFVRELNYLNNVHYLTGYDIDGYQVYYELTEYKVLDGDNQTYNTEAGKEDLNIRFTGNVKDVTKVYINDKALDKKHYKLTSGSVIVTLKKDYLSTLEAGTYTLKVEYENGINSKAEFAITSEVIDDDGKGDENGKDNEKVPATSDNIYAYSLLLIVSLAGLALSKKYLKN